MQKVQAHDDESGSGSGYSDLSNLENDTDTIGRAILRHERDARRLQSVLNGTRQYTGNKLPRPYTSKRLQAIEARKMVEADAGQRTREIEPDLNVPRNWNRRHKAEQDWIRQSRIPVSVDSPERISAATILDRNMILPHRTAYTGDEYWYENAINVEDTPPSMKRRRAQLPRRSLNPKMASIVNVENPPSDVLVTATRPAASPEVLAPSKASELKAKLQAFRDRRYPRSSIPVQKPPSPASSDKENQPVEIDSAHEGWSLQKPVTQVYVSRMDKQASHNRSESMQMLDRLAKVTQSPPRQKKELEFDVLSLEAPTPLITGGWIDTPNPDRTAANTVTSNSANQRMPNNAAEVLANGAASDPMHYASQSIPKRRALAEITPDAASEPGESMRKAAGQAPTVQAIDVVQAERNGHSPYAASEVQSKPATVEKIENESDKPSIQSYKATSEIGRLAALDKHITNVLTTHRETTQSSRKASASIAKTNTVNKRSAPKNVNGETICEHCNSLYPSAWRGLWIEFRRNFCVEDKSAWSGIRLTRLGTVMLAYICWYILESSLCLQYCKPRTALPNTAPVLVRHAPVFPTVIPTLLFRPLEPFWRPFKREVDWFVDVLLNWFLGDLHPCNEPVVIKRAIRSTSIAHKAFNEPARWTAAVSTVAATSSRRVVASAIDAIDDVGQMW